MKMPKVWYVPWIPGYAVGICLPPFGIFIEKKSKWNRPLHLHEIGHWLQYNEWGLFKFYKTILVEYFKYGPHKAPVEADASFRGVMFKAYVHFNS